MRDSEAFAHLQRQRAQEEEARLRNLMETRQLVLPEFLTFVCFKWKPVEGYRSKFTDQHVNILARMIRRNYAHPHKLICFTDDAAGIDTQFTEPRPLWSDHAELVNASMGKLGPSCYRRLKMFSRDAEKWIGKRICAMDLDVVITADISPIVARKEDFVIWGDTAPPTPYNGSLMLFDAGARPQLWEDFDPIESPKATRAARFVGSDQAWIGLKLGRREATFSTHDGVYSFRNHLLRRRLMTLPREARLIIFHGHLDPWGEVAQRLEWVRKYYV